MLKTRFILTLVASAVLLTVWGWYLAAWQPRPSYPLLYQLWGAACLVCLVLSRWLPLRQLIWGLALAPILLLPPDMSRIGFTTVAGPVWICWLLVLVASQLRDRVSRRMGLVYGLLIFWFVQSAFFVETYRHDFAGFRALIPELTPGTVTTNCIAALLAAVTLFVRRHAGAAPQVMAGAFTVYFFCVYFRVLPADGWLHIVITAALVAAVIAMSLRDRYRPGPRLRSHWFKPMMVMAFTAVVFSAVPMPAEHKLELIMLLAAMRLSHLLILAMPIAASTRQSYRHLLLLLFMILSGWVMLGWRLPRSFLDGVSVWEVVSLTRFVLPVVLARLVLWQDAEASKAKNYSLLFISGYKFVSLALIVVGFVLRDAQATATFIATQQLIVWAVLSLGFL